MRDIMLWGYHTEDYQSAFDLDDAALLKPILEFGSGPSAFNKEQTDKGREVVSCCPMFNLDKATLKTKTSFIFHENEQAIVQDREKYELLIQSRAQGLTVFFDDYEKGLAEHRYLAVNSNELPFSDAKFAYALSSHYFFKDLHEQDVNFHLSMIKALTKVATEVRIYPIAAPDGKLSPLVGPVLLGLQQLGLGAEVREVKAPSPLEGTVMLRVWAEACSL